MLDPGELVPDPAVVVPGFTKNYDARSFYFKVEFLQFVDIIGCSILVSIWDEFGIIWDQVGSNVEPYNPPPTVRFLREFP